jgi:hypothetical protein
LLELVTSQRERAQADERVSLGGISIQCFPQSSLGAPEVARVVRFARALQVGQTESRCGPMIGRMLTQALLQRPDLAVYGGHTAADHVTRGTRRPDRWLAQPPRLEPAAKATMNIAAPNANRRGLRDRCLPWTAVGLSIISSRLLARRTGSRAAGP